VDDAAVRRCKVQYPGYACDPRQEGIAMNGKRRLLILLCALLVACTEQQWFDKIVSPGDRAEALKYLDELRAGQLDDIEQHLDPKVFKGDNHTLLQNMQAALPQGAPTSVTLFGAQYLTINGNKRFNLSFEYNFSGQWRLANVAIVEEAGIERIVGMHVYMRTQSLAEQNSFRLAGRTPMSYLILGLAILLPLFSMYCFILSIFTKFAGRKWPWVLLTLIGVGRLSLNWTSGAWDFSVMQVMLLSAGFTKSFYGPLLLYVAFPVGPTLFLLSRKALMVPLAKDHVAHLLAVEPQGGPQG